LFEAKWTSEVSLVDQLQTMFEYKLINKIIWNVKDEGIK
jgi:hypothetical protein